MKFIGLTVIAISSSSEIFPLWYLLTRNLAASSFRFLKLSMMWELRQDMIMEVVRFQAPSLFPHKLGPILRPIVFIEFIFSDSIQPLLKSGHLLFIHNNFFFVFYSCSRFDFCGVGQSTSHFGAISKSGWVLLVDCQLNSLGKFWFGGSGVEILCSNRCQLLLSSSIFIAERRESCPITSLMRQLVKTCLRRFMFDFGGNGLSLWMVGSVGPIDWNGCIRLVCFLIFHRFSLCRPSFSLGLFQFLVVWSDYGGRPFVS